MQGQSDVLSMRVIYAVSSDCVLDYGTLFGLARVEDFAHARLHDCESPAKSAKKVESGSETCRLYLGLVRFAYL